MREVLIDKKENLGETKTDVFAMQIIILNNGKCKLNCRDQIANFLPVQILHSGHRDYHIGKKGIIDTLFIDPIIIMF